MSMMMVKKELRQKCIERGIPIVSIEEERSGKMQKIDYIHLLADLYREQCIESGVWSSGMEWVYHNLQDSPKLAQGQYYFKPEFIEECMQSEEWVADTKHDGCRMLVYYHPETGFEFFGRNRSVDTFFYTNYTHQIKGLEGAQGWYPASFVIDTELISLNPTINGRIVTDTVLSGVTSLLALDRIDSYRAQVDGGFPLRFEVFDMLMLCDQNIMSWEYHSRREKLTELVHYMTQKTVHYEEVNPSNWFFVSPLVLGGAEEKQKFYSDIVSKKGEGIILKNIHGIYEGRESRGGANKDTWVKYKRTVSESVGNDIDGYIVGFELGKEGKEYEELVATLDIAVMLYPSGEEHIIARVPNIPLEYRKSVTVIGDDGKPTLRPDVYKKVVTIDGQDISARARRFSHAKIVRFREDKSWTECTFEERILNDLIL